MARGGGDQKEDSALGIIGMVGAVAVLMTALAWLFGSNSIVFFWAPVFIVAGRMWAAVPGGEQFLEPLERTYHLFMASPKDVGFFKWVAWANSCLRPLAILLAVVMLMHLVYVLIKRRPDVQRKIDSGELLEKMSFIFTGTAPVLHLRHALVNNKDPLWARQTFPEDVFLKVKVGGKPLVQDGHLVADRVRAYFRGLKVDKKMQPVFSGGRLTSNMLGRQIVHLPVDRGSKVVYEDRFSDIGKVLFGMFVAKAFGGKDGAADYAKARDQLNNSCRGVDHGLANLKVAQWIYDKYRGHKTARRLFAVHHWEYSFLYRLLAIAKRQGRCGHWEFMWLKPMNRVLFYVLNTIGRDTPHTESASVFNHAVYENMCARMQRLPYTLSQKGGRITIEPFLFVEGAILGLETEHHNWCDAIVDTDDWWDDPSVWKTLEGVRWESYSVPDGAELIETEFDSQMVAQRQEAALNADRKVSGEMASYKRDGIDLGDV